MNLCINAKTAHHTWLMMRMKDNLFKTDKLNKGGTKMVRPRDGRGKGVGMPGGGRGGRNRGAGNRGGPGRGLGGGRGRGRGRRK